MSSGAIYTALGRLSERGFVSWHTGKTTTGRVGRPRKFYRLEPAGARALRDSYLRVQAMASGLIPKLTELAGQ